MFNRTLLVVPTNSLMPNQPRMLISIVIPAFNRPDLLQEAAHSIAAQTASNYEVIVIDNGSSPPISLEALEHVLGDRVRLCRYDSPLGVPRAKNAGIEAARGEIIMLHDDDDLLAPNAVETLSAAFCAHSEIDCIFLGVRLFGPYSDGPAKNRLAALRKILERTKPEAVDGLYVFGRNLFQALLDAVPIDFQRPAARRSAWNIIGGFDENCLFSESAWAVRAASIAKIALSHELLTEWRIHGNNFGWLAGMTTEDNRRRQIENGLSSARSLLKIFDREKEEWASRAKAAKWMLATQLFDKSYYLLDKDRREGFLALLCSLRLFPGFRHLKLALHYCMPSTRSKRR